MSAIQPSEVTLIVIAKQPLPGRCKTRLCPPLAPAEAAGLAEAALADTLATVAATPARRHLLALDGRPGRWLAPGFDVLAQADGGLDARLAAAFEAAGGPALLIGMDTPQTSVAALKRAIAALCGDGIDAVLGPAEDGGYWSIGLRRRDGAAFIGVPMSSAATGAAQRRRLAGLGLRCAELEPMRDVDTFDDARVVARLCPGSRFAAAFEALPWAIAA
jgi:rSAM/selenodomain-associated transferase 1